MRRASSTWPIGEQREAGVHRVARPDEMIAAEVVARIAPWHAQRRDDGAREGAVLVQRAGPRRSGGLLDAVRRQVRRVGGSAPRPSRFQPRERRPAMPS